MKIAVHSGTLIALVVNFAVFMAVLVKLLYKPLQKILAERRQKISSDLGDAQKAKANWEKKQQESQVLIETAEKNAAEIIASARSEGEQVRDEIISEARQDAENMRNRTKTSLEKARAVAELELKSSVVDLALLAATKALGSKMTPEINEALITRMLDNLEKEASKGAVSNDS